MSNWKESDKEAICYNCGYIKDQHGTMTRRCVKPDVSLYDSDIYIYQDPTIIFRGIPDITDIMVAIDSILIDIKKKLEVQKKITIL